VPIDPNLGMTTARRLDLNSSWRQLSLLEDLPVQVIEELDLVPFTAIVCRSRDLASTICAPGPRTAAGIV